MSGSPHLNTDPTPGQTDEAGKRHTEPQRLDRLTLTELVLPGQSNHYGTLFGPNGLALLGKAAYLVANRYTRQAVVMASATRIEFLRPVPVGAVVTIDARVVRVGTSSLTAHISASFSSGPDAPCQDVLRGDFEMVAVDATGRPTAIVAPPLHAAG